MKTVVGVIVICLLTGQLHAQDTTRPKLKLGVLANGGASSLVQGMGMNMNMYSNGYYPNGSNMPMYSFTMSWGGGVSLTLPVHQRWSVVSNITYMSRGANYSEMYTSNSAKYRFGYLDIWIMGQYNNVPRNQIKFIGSFGLTESTLLSSYSESSTGNQGMMSNMNPVDVGMVLGPGLEVGLKNGGAIQAKLLYTRGFTNIFNGIYYQSGMHSSNAAILLQVGYVF